jgi:hypothetical protein
MSDLTQIKSDFKLHKLILLLSSDVDGEVLGAARAIGRTLQTAGRDWHDLADALTHDDRANDKPTTPDWRTAVSDCLAHVEWLTPREVSFLRNIRRASRISAKQSAWLTDIWEQVRS